VNELLMYAFIFENRMYRVALSHDDLTSISNESRIARMVEQSLLVVDLQTNQIKECGFEHDAGSITTSNPLYHIFMSLPLITLNDLKGREPQLYL